MAGLFDLTGRTVVATGGGSGIGLAFLRGCARQGATVVSWDVREDDPAAREAALVELGAAAALSLRVDVSDEAAVDRAMAATLARTGRVDCVFANAGINRRAPSFTDLPTETYRQLLGVNLDGAFFTLRTAARHMKARAEAGEPGGSLVACGSLSIFHGVPGMQHYAAAKGALLAMIRGLAVEMGPYGVRANMIVPGFIMTGLTNGPERQAMVDRFSAITPLGRPGELADIEGPAAYLASDASRFQTGDTIILDGGRLVKNI